MKHTVRIRLADTDAAGRIYFAAAMRIAHESFESFMDVVGFDLQRIITTQLFALPVVRVEANYKAALMLGDEVTVETKVRAIGKRSVSFDHTIVSGNGKPAVDIIITHAVISKKTGRAMTMPVSLRDALTVR